MTDEILRDTEAHTVYKRSLFLADDASPNGMKLVLQEELVDDGSLFLKRRRSLCPAHQFDRAKGPV
ncbi:hypothetical protein [Haematobacter genomosp. 1]|uniref:Uncharacterized protein n=1 Tax=Haematobacter genomosp. 1 TaxID=366618 RepID=A0A212AA39_9RHOB|nr:hypothetical protein [Haematobacter genomosp. 1]OWJ76987.1 hypothetical protein CDV49_12580 [Haematobacter genomosp. 1]